MASSGCCGAGNDAGMYKSNSSYSAGSCTKEPSIKETLSGFSAVVGGRDGGGRAIFYETIRFENVLWVMDQDHAAYKLIFCPSCGGYAYGLYTFLARDLVIEAQERLVRLVALVLALLDDCKA